MAKRKQEEDSLDEDKVEETEVEEHDDDDEDAEPIKTDPGVAGGPIAQSFEPRIPLGSKARAMKDQLAKQAKVRVFIPLANGEKQGVTQSVVLNGYPMYIRKGTYVEVTKAVAEVLEVKLQHKMSIENHPSRVSADQPVKMTTYGS
jgi:hypothetical protein